MGDAHYLSSQEGGLHPACSPSLLTLPVRTAAPLPGCYAGSVSSRKLMRVSIKPCLPVSGTHAYAHGQERAQLRGCLAPDIAGSHRPVQQTQSPDPAQGSSQGGRQT